MAVETVSTVIIIGIQRPKPQRTAASGSNLQAANHGSLPTRYGRFGWYFEKFCGMVVFWESWSWDP